MRDQPRRALHDEIAGRSGWTDAMVGEMSRRRGVICQCEIKHPIPAGKTRGALNSVWALSVRQTYGKRPLEEVRRVASEIHLWSDVARTYWLRCRVWDGASARSLRPRRRFQYDLALGRAGR